MSQRQTRLRVRGGHLVAAVGVQPAGKALVGACAQLVQRHKPHRSLAAVGGEGGGGVGDGEGEQGKDEEEENEFV